MYDIAVIGCGRVGLPLLLAFANAGKKVAAVDMSSNILSSIDLQVMPFHEPHCQEILLKHKIDGFYPKDDYRAKYYVITVGTPVDHHIETNLSYVENVVQNLIKKNKLTKESTIILRSTVAPGTTKYIHQILKKAGIKCNLAMCPERLAEGKAWEELHTLPQIIGTYFTDDSESEAKAVELFKCLGVKIYCTSSLEAELAKLFCNIYRYINFAIPNYFMYLMNEFGLSSVYDTHNMFEMIKDNYPRMQGLMTPGLAAGTCIPGDRLIKVYDTDSWKNIMYKSIKDLYEEFHEDCRYYIDSFSSDLTDKNIKLIKNVITRKFSGKMLTFEFENSKKFVCTEDHLIPIKRSDKLVLVRAIDINADDEVFMN